MTAGIPRYEITHGDVTAEAVVVQAGGKTIVQPVEPFAVRSGESFTISRRVDADAPLLTASRSAFPTGSNRQ